MEELEEELEYVRDRIIRLEARVRILRENHEHGEEAGTFHANEAARALQHDAWVRMQSAPCLMPLPGLGRDGRVTMPPHHEQLRIQQVIRERLATREAHASQLAMNYYARKRKYIDTLRNDNKERRRDKMRRMQDKQTDLKLLMLTRDCPIVKEERPSGLLSYKPMENNMVYGAPQNKEESEIMLHEIRLAGGTCGGYERWMPTLATLVDQHIHHEHEKRAIGSVRVLDPMQEYINARQVNPWSETERLIFVDKYCEYPKNFRKIAQSLPFKSVQEVVAFYYEHKDRIGLKKLAKEAAVAGGGNADRSTLQHSRSGCLIGDGVTLDKKATAFGALRRAVSYSGFAVVPRRFIGDNFVDERVPLVVPSDGCKSYRSVDREADAKALHHALRAFGTNIGSCKTLPIRVTYGELERVVLRGAFSE
ncbi:Myb-like protein P [Porphyridium purpureum]|uniref:Myb-like protein P n=1 Tax=Porphyridium purpureum TaxID=35688 RepID=A0A5J4YNW7_PORPP|nr:Myb-like protein P [Porphyridium purpureum]|eukprot:POR2245..scf295_9